MRMPDSTASMTRRTMASAVLVLFLVAGCSSPSTTPSGPRQAPSPLLSASPNTFSSGIVVPDPNASASDAFGPFIGMVPLTTAVITNEGTAAAAGYRIFVAANGAATFESNTATGSLTLPVSLAQGFFSDLKAVPALSSLATGACGYTSGAVVIVQLGGQTTPNLDCPGGGYAQAIAEDVQKIVETLGVTVGPGVGGQSGPPVLKA